MTRPLALTLCLALTATALAEDPDTFEVPDPAATVGEVAPAAEPAAPAAPAPASEAAPAPAAEPAAPAAATPAPATPPAPAAEPAAPAAPAVPEAPPAPAAEPAAPAAPAVPEAPPAPSAPPAAVERPLAIPAGPSPGAQPEAAPPAPPPATRREVRVLGVRLPHVPRIRIVQVREVEAEPVPPPPPAPPVAPAPPAPAAPPAAPARPRRGLHRIWPFSRRDPCPEPAGSARHDEPERHRYRGGPWVAAETGITPFVGGTGTSVGAEVGWGLGSTLRLAVATRTVLQTRFAEDSMALTYAGLQPGIVLMPRKRVNLRGDILFGWGAVHDLGGQHARVVSLTEPRLGIEARLIKGVFFGGYYGYRGVHSTGERSMPAAAVSGPTAGIKLRLGWP